MDEFCKAGTVILCKTAQMGTVDVQNAPNFIFIMNGQDDFRLGGTITGDMAGKGVDIGYQLDAVACPGGTADTTALFDADAGRFSLEGS